MLVPEIGLTPQISQQFRSWFGERVAILHSGLSQGERFDQWHRIRKGESSVVVGTRSAVFAPLERLGLVIVDEEQDSSYKQSEQPRYNGRDVAIKRSQLENVPVILGSATPQLETHFKAVSQKLFRYQRLGSRVLDRPLPQVKIIDMREEFQRRGKGAVISDALRQAIEQRLTGGEQTLILINRRGYAAMVICRSCGHNELCRNCSIALTFHREQGRQVCHYCGHTRPVPARCPECGKEFIYYVGEGTEKIQEMIQGLFSGAIVARFDRDTTRRKGSYEKILGAFRRREIDILIGTQMIAKGHDFPNVTLVGVLGADRGLRLADFRSAERTFQLLTQVAGRAGRGGKPGQVIIQTYFPNHYCLRSASAQDYESFSTKELSFRRHFRYPPYTALANVIVHGKEEPKARKMAETVVDQLRVSRRSISSRQQLRILGPAPAVLERLKRDYRFQVLLKATNRKALHEVVESALNNLRNSKIDLSRVMVDVDPIDLL
jgi:primosomal protein N' (replication factor Y)